MTEKQPHMHDDYEVIQAVEPFDVVIGPQDAEGLRSMVAGEFFDRAKTTTSHVDEASDRTLGRVGGGRIPGDWEAPSLFAGASLEHIGNAWRLVVLRVINDHAAEQKVGVRYFVESDGEKVFEAKSQARVLRRTSQEIVIDDSGETEEQIGHSRLEYEKLLDTPSCLRLQRQLARAVARYEVLQAD